MNKTQDQKTILLVEDDKFISKAYADGLTRAGFKVITAFDGEDGLKAAKEENPDLILVDLVMPDKDGFQFLAEKQIDENIKNIPVIVVSNLDQAKDFKEAKKFGANDYIVKSNSSMEEVIKKVKDLCP